MAVTLKDVVRAAGVSIPTASLILNGRNLPFKESTRKAVLVAAESLSYRPDSIARRTGSATTRAEAIGMLIRSESASRVANAPVYEFICGVNDVLMEREHFLVLVKLAHLKLDEKSGKQPRVIGERFVDGLIVETGLTAELEQAVARYRIPTIWLNSNHQDRTDCVYPDEVHSGATVTEHLTGLGHRRILFLAPPSGLRRSDVHFSVFDRQSGYERSMAAHGLPTSIMYARDEEGRTVIGHVVQTIVESRDGGDPITAVVTYGIPEAVHLRFELERVGIHCPEDVSIVTADDLHALRRNWADTSGISCDRYQMGRMAGEMMIRRVETGEPQPSIAVKGQLIPGGTAGPAPSRGAPKTKKGARP